MTTLYLGLPILKIEKVVHGWEFLGCFLFPTETHFHIAAPLGYLIRTLSMTTGDLRNESKSINLNIMIQISIIMDMVI